MRDRRPDLWRDGDFLKRWLGQTISLLDATPAQIGALGAAQFAPCLLLTIAEVA